jgi:hypothetical protein
MLGEGNYLATAPRIKSWSEFKNTILKFENGELKGKPGAIGKEMNDQMQGFLKHLQDKNKKKNSGCLGVALILFKANAKASTFAIRTSQPHKAKIAKELALPTHHDTTKWTDKQHTEKKNEGITAVLQKSGFSG